MNFMAGRYEETGSRSSSSSSSSSFHHRTGGQVPAYSYGGGGGGAPPAGDDEDAVLIQREHMFDKVVTPSDVGKLNRLVIPKQHAEKYFPLDSSANEKGLLLNFEDRNGKPWRFRYSYWNSSQSYVMTKGWSRFVKEKKLDAGDIVSFQRGAGDSAKDRLFIDWRRRPDAPPDSAALPYPHHHFSFRGPQQPANPWGPLFMHHPPPYLQQQQQHPYGGGSYSTIVNGSPCPPGSIVYLRSTLPGGRGGLAPGMQLPPMSGGGYMEQQQQQQQQQMMMNRAGEEEEVEVFESVPVVQGNKASAAKRLRLFGVNMDCPISPPHHSQDHINTNNIISDSDILMPSSALPHNIHHHHHHPMPMSMTMPMPFSSSSPSPSPSSSSSLARLRHSDDDKGKGSMSLDLDI